MAIPLRLLICVNQEFKVIPFGQNDEWLRTKLNRGSYLITDTPQKDLNTLSTVSSVLEADKTLKSRGVIKTTYYITAEACVDKNIHMDDSYNPIESIEIVVRATKSSSNVSLHAWLAAFQNERIATIIEQG